MHDHPVWRHIGLGQVDARVADGLAIRYQYRTLIDSIRCCADR